MSAASKIQAVMKQVGQLSKDGKMQGVGNYRYLSEEKVTGELHEACAKIGLVIYPIAMTILEERDDKTASDKIMHNVRIQSIYRIMDADEPESFIDATAFGEGSDMGDKTLNKCMTAAYKYTLRQTFMISSGDDPDHTVSAEAVSSTAKQQPAKMKLGQKSPPAVLCEWPGCNNKISGYKSKVGRVYTAEQVVNYSRRDCAGRALCYDHSAAWKERRKPGGEEGDTDPKSDLE